MEKSIIPQEFHDAQGAVANARNFVGHVLRSRDAKNTSEDINQAISACAYAAEEIQKASNVLIELTNDLKTKLESMQESLDRHHKALIDYINENEEPDNQAKFEPDSPGE